MKFKISRDDIERYHFSFLVVLVLNYLNTTQWRHIEEHRYSAFILGLDIDGIEWRASRPRFCPRGKIAWHLLYRRLVGLKADLDALEKRGILPLQEINPWSSGEKSQTLIIPITEIRAGYLLTTTTGRYRCIQWHSMAMLCYSNWFVLLE
jgi:hypothetical protein